MVSSICTYACSFVLNKSYSDSKSFAPAVKCNSDPLLLRIFAALGGGFDCASKSEIAAVLDLGVDPSRIIYAHTCKLISHIKLMIVS